MMRSDAMLGLPTTAVAATAAAASHGVDAGVQWRRSGADN